MKKTVFCLIIAIAFAGCVSSPQKLTTVIKPGSYKELGTCEDSACSFLLLGIIPIGFGSLPEDAYQNAIKLKGADGLINPAISESWYFAVIGSVYCSAVSGTAIKYKTEQEILADQQKEVKGAVGAMDLKQRLQDLEEMKKAGTISEAEYAKLRDKIIERY